MTGVPAACFSVPTIPRRVEETRTSKRRRWHAIRTSKYIPQHQRRVGRPYEHRNSNFVTKTTHQRCKLSTWDLRGLSRAREVRVLSGLTESPPPASVCPPSRIGRRAPPEGTLIIIGVRATTKHDTSKRYTFFRPSHFPRTSRKKRDDTKRIVYPNEVRSTHQITPSLSDLRGLYA